jgi:DNA-binding Xre family transcriptional regulator
MYINIKKITTAELKTLSLNDLVAICKSLDNGNGDWSDVTADEYDYILQTAIDSITDYQTI